MPSRKKKGSNKGKRNGSNKKNDKQQVANQSPKAESEPKVEKTEVADETKVTSDPSLGSPPMFYKNLQQNKSYSRRLSVHNATSPRSAHITEEDREHAKEAHVTVSQMDQLMDAFRLFDRNHSGYIDADDLEYIIRCLGAKSLEKDRIAALISQFDSTGDGNRIDFEDFCTMIGNGGDIFGLFDMTKLWQVEQLIVQKEKLGCPFKDQLNNYFPGSLEDTTFVNRLVKVLASHKFTKDSCIPCVSLCRDEITTPLADLIKDNFDHVFSFSSLGGMLTCGKTGFGAAHAHAPVVDGREKYMYLAMPHIGIDAFGDIGVVRRPGRVKESSACGALIAFHSELHGGNVNLLNDPDDVEQCTLKQKVFSNMNYGDKPSLVELTKLAMSTILKDLEHLIDLTVDTRDADYAVVTGIQIHGPKWVGQLGSAMDFVFPGPAFVVKNGIRTEILEDIKDFF